MARKIDLRGIHKEMILNAVSSSQEKAATGALNRAIDHVKQKFGSKIRLDHQKNWYLKDIVAALKNAYPNAEFHNHFEKSSIRPDGGILYLTGGPNEKHRYPILIVEVKNQGTNDLRKKEGLPKQAKGNAIERLGKNVIGLRTALLRENIFPFVCFGYGCDFADDSSIRDRVTTIAMFGKLNKTYLFNELDGRLNRGSFYFQEGQWSEEKMYEIMADIAVRSIQYYFARYGEASFLPK